MPSLNFKKKSHWNLHSQITTEFTGRICSDRRISVFGLPFSDHGVVSCLKAIFLCGPLYKIWTPMGGHKLHEIRQNSVSHHLKPRPFAGQKRRESETRTPVAIPKILILKNLARSQGLGLMYPYQPLPVLFNQIHCGIRNRLVAQRDT